MSILISSTTAGSLKITNNGTNSNGSASPMTSYLCNLETVNVYGYLNPPEQSVCIANSNMQVIFESKLENISNIGASGSGTFPTLQNAVDAIASLIIH